jgi:hypothetical protein
MYASVSVTTNLPGQANGGPDDGDAFVAFARVFSGLLRCVRGAWWLVVWCGVSLCRGGKSGGT